MSADWKSCSVVRNRDGDLWTNYAGMWHTPEMAPFSGDILAKYDPTPVLDADGLPVVRTVGDRTALDALPVGSVVMEGSSGAPLRAGPFGILVMPGVFHRFPDGWHVVSGHGVRTPEFDLGPLTVLHIPGEVLDD